MKCQQRPGSGDQIAVVIGCGRQEEMQLRAGTAAKWALSHPHGMLILSGDGRKGGKRITEAALLRRLILRQGVADEQLLLERKAGSTIGNAVNTRRLLAGTTPRPLYVVTSPFHVRRALLVFGRVFESAWIIEPLPCAPAGDDFRRAQGEHDLSMTERFFDNIAPGDLSAMEAKLGPNGKPAYVAA